MTSHPDEYPDSADPSPADAPPLDPEIRAAREAAEKADFYSNGSYSDGGAEPVQGFAGDIYNEPASDPTGQGFGSGARAEEDQFGDGTAEPFYTDDDGGTSP